MAPGVTARTAALSGHVGGRFAGFLREPLGEIDGGGDGDGEGDAGIAVVALQEEDEHGHGAGEHGDQPGDASEIHTRILTGGEDAYADEADPVWTPEDLLWIDAPGW